MKSDIVHRPMQESPVTYMLKLSLPEGSEKYPLVFLSAHQVYNRYGDVNGYSYSFHGRTYRDVESLWKTSVEQLSEDVSIGTDNYGEKVLKTYESIPTFDSGDREWHSKFLCFLFFDGKEIHLVTMSGGYRIAQLNFYKKLLSADIRMMPIFDKLGWPMDGITWTETTA